VCDSHIMRTAREAFEYWLQTPHRLNDDPLSSGDVFLRFIRMIDEAGWQLVPKEPTEEMLENARDAPTNPKIYKAMLASALIPAPPKHNAGDVTGDSLEGMAKEIEDVARAHARWSQAHEIVLCLTGYLRALGYIERVSK
jgi:hypothetical protein